MLVDLSGKEIERLMRLHCPNHETTISLCPTSLPLIIRRESSLRVEPHLILSSCPSQAKGTKLTSFSSFHPRVESFAKSTIVFLALCLVSFQGKFE